MVEVGAMTADGIEAVRAEIAAEVEAAIEFGDQSPMPDPDDLLANVYSDSTGRPL